MTAFHLLLSTRLSGHARSLDLDFLQFFFPHFFLSLPHKLHRTECHCVSSIVHENSHMGKWREIFGLIYCWHVLVDLIDKMSFVEFFWVVKKKPEPQVVKRATSDKFLIEGTEKKTNKSFLQICKKEKLRSAVTLILITRKG